MNHLEQPQYAGLLEIITGEWGYALHKSANPVRAWTEIQYRIVGMADCALLLNHDDAAFEELRALSSLALEHRFNSEVK